MEALLRYVEAHPWWTFVYLIIICSMFEGMFKIRINRKPKDQ